MKRIQTEVERSATLSGVWEQLRDTASMRAWSPLITSLPRVIEVEDRLKMGVTPVGGRPITFAAKVAHAGRALEDHLR